MVWLRRLFILACLVGGLVAVGRFLPDRLQHFFASVGWTGFGPSGGDGGADAAEDAAELDPERALKASAHDAAGRDDAWDQRLFRPLERAFHLPPKSVRRREGRAEIRFPKGLPLHEYAWGVERACALNGLVLVDAREVRLAKAGGVSGTQARYVLARGAHHPGGEENTEESLTAWNGPDTLRLTLNLGDVALPGSARLALVVLGLDSIGLNDAALLQATPFPINLAFDPHNPNPALQALKSAGGEITLLAEIPMEPMAYPYINPGKRALYIHFDEAAVNEALDAALAQMTQARGIVTRYGDRAIENRALLRRIYAYLAPRHLPLLDLTGSPRSLAREAAAEAGGLAQRALAVRDTAAFEMELAKKVAQAVKSGEAVFALHYARHAFEHLQKLVDERSDGFAEQGLAFVPLTHLTSMPKPPTDSTVSVDTAKKPIPKPPKGR